MAAPAGNLRAAMQTWSDRFNAGTEQPDASRRCDASKGAISARLQLSPRQRRP
jgi:hypothetical protein